MRKVSLCFLSFSVGWIYGFNFLPQSNPKIYIAGHAGLVGSAIVRKLAKNGFTNLVLKTSQQLDLRNQQAVEAFFNDEKPEYVFLAAAKVGGILANSSYPAEFIYDNLAMELNVIHAAYKHGVEKLLFLGSSCIYPRNCPQPMKEEYLLTSALEPTNDAYALAKIAGIFLCQKYRKQYGARFIACMPTNLYGPNDYFNFERSHVIPALIAKFTYAKEHAEKSLTLWGSGMVRREFLHVDDLADACVFLMKYYNENEIINIGTGIDLTIKDLAFLVKDIIKYDGEIIFDVTKPDGPERKLLDVSKIKRLGWRATIDLQTGLKQTIDWFLNNPREKIRT